MITKLKYLCLAGVLLVISACQFTETIAFNADGSGSMELEINLGQMMEITKGFGNDQVSKRIDTTVYINDVLEKQRDSIARLPKKDRDLLEKMASYKIRVFVDDENNEMNYVLVADFNNVNEMNDISEMISKVGDLAPNSGTNEVANGKSEEFIGVSYSFVNNTFVRDAYIKDENLHQQQVDSMQSMETVLGASFYLLNYTFAKPIRHISNDEAQVSNDRKSISLRVPFWEYYKNPDVLDLEVEFEK